MYQNTENSDNKNNSNPTEEVAGVVLLPDGGDLFGTSKVGSFSCSLSVLLEALGPSLGPSGDNKTTEEWHFMTPFGVAALYDYKGFCCSIGGRNSKVVAPLHEYLNHMIEKNCGQSSKPS